MLCHVSFKTFIRFYLVLSFHFSINQMLNKRSSYGGPRPTENTTHQKTRQFPRTCLQNNISSNSINSYLLAREMGRGKLLSRLIIIDRTKYILSKNELSGRTHEASLVKIFNHMPSMLRISCETFQTPKNFLSFYEFVLVSVMRSMLEHT